jgi:zinc/manganese transport system permease protein
MKKHLTKCPETVDHYSQILWSTWGSLIPTAILYGILLMAWFLLHEKMGRIFFYVTFSFVVTASVQLVGVYLVFASLIIPALATVRLDGKKRLWAGYFLGALSYFMGIVLSAVFDLPTGAMIVWTMAIVGIISGYLIHLLKKEVTTI